MSSPPDIILFHYTYSPYARRIVWYLTLRNIPYAQCSQPPIMPRPDLAALNVSYRRIPVLALGRDIYCDTRLQLPKLEALYPSNPLGATDSNEHRALERLLTRWTSDAGVFSRAASLIPTNLPTLKDPRFRKDRADFSGRSWAPEDMERGRPEGLVHIRDAFDLLETTLLADGREWVFKTEGPSLGDIEAIWPFHWLVELPGALPADVISAAHFPKVFAWISRFRAALKEAQAKQSKPVTLQGADAVQRILAAGFAEEKGPGVDERDPLGFKEGAEVAVSPTDSGASHKDVGRLVGLTSEEVVVEKRTRVGDKVIRVHAPRWGFRVVDAKNVRTKL